MSGLNLYWNEVNLRKENMVQLWEMHVHGQINLSQFDFVTSAVFN